MKKYLLGTLTASYLLTLTIPSVYASSQEESITSLINKLTDNQVAVIKTFPSINNLVGVVIQPKDSTEGQQTIVYVDKDAQYLISGALIAANGENVSQTDGKKYVTTKMADSAYHDLNSATWIEEGNRHAKHIMYVIADPNCIYCHKLYEQTRPAVQKGDLAIRWIWVGFLKPNSKSRAEAIIGAKNPVAAMAENETKFNDTKEEGALNASYKPNATTSAKFEKNMSFLNKYNFPGTPVILYKDKEGKPQASFGLPDKAELDEIMNTAKG